MRASIEQLEPRRLFAAGDIDTTFGNGGFEPTPRGQLVASIANGVIVLASGKLLVTGLEALSRHNPDGSIDASFGDNGDGQARVNEGSIVDVELTPEGKILAAVRLFDTGGVPTTFALVRFTADGLRDTTFGAQGKVVVNATVGTNAIVYDIGVQSNGNVVVYGGLGGLTGAVYRLTAAGALDNTFTPFRLKQPKNSFGIKIAPDDRILLGGGELLQTEAGKSFTLARLNADGALDTAFADNGFYDDFIFPVDDLIIQSDGKIATLSPGDTNLISRFNADGSIDSTFGTRANSGQPFGARIQFGDRNHGGSKLARDASGRYLVLTETGIARVNADGTFDNAFGRIVGDENFGAVFHGIAVEADDDIVVLGGTNGEYPSLFHLQKDNADPTSPMSVSGGTLTIDATANNDRVFIDKSRVMGGPQLRVTRNGIGRAFDGVTDVVVSLGAGHDFFEMLSNEPLPMTISGGAGNDRIGAGAGDDFIGGGDGYDHIDAGAGNDTVTGDDGRDWIRGGTGDDSLAGNAWGDFLDGGEGNDVLLGGGMPDRLTGGPGNDTLSGGLGNDFFFTNDGAPDHLFGDAGVDSADADNMDVLTSIETT